MTGLVDVKSQFSSCSHRHPSRITSNVVCLINYNLIPVTSDIHKVFLSSLHFTSLHLSIVLKLSIFLSNVFA